MKSILWIMIFPILLFSNNFPTISGKTLQGKKIEVPNKTSSQLLIIGFDMKSADPMEAWVRGLKLIPSANISWVQIPVIGPVPPFVDGFIKGGMRKSMPEEVQVTFFPYFGSKKFDILKSLQNSETLTDNVTPFIVLLSAEGAIEFSKQIRVSTDNIQLIQSKVSSINDQ
ncbi:hypothetical protein DID73_01395 [Candidatus Marinamargulisbacteria bacterium SCGC AG-343-K17]|nr:hypothetical protein DID73_01395 [Candidatus Marinamargulisbacteria bacterium SCGC AG-343-K17]